MAFKSSEHAQAYWKENLGIMGSLLAVWFLVSFGSRHFVCRCTEYD